MNKIIILLFLLVILLFVYINFNTISETFKGNNYLELMSKSKASEIIRNVDSFDKYNTLDKQLRNIRSNDNIYQHYISSLSTWDDYEVVLFNWLKKGLLEKLPEIYMFLFKDVYVAKYNDNIEMGFPHTHSNTIFLTGKFVKEIIAYYNKNDMDGCISHIGSVIIHEAVHIWQRRDKEFFKHLYKEWNFTKYKKIYNFSSIRSKNRYNPDGVSLLWGWKYPKIDKEIIPMAVYSKGASNISHVNLIGVRLEKIGTIPVIPPILDFTNLNKIDEYSDFFGNISGNNYHPNELSAEIISRLITKEILDKSNAVNAVNAVNIYNKVFRERNT